MELEPPAEEQQGRRWSSRWGFGGSSSKGGEELRVWGDWVRVGGWENKRNWGFWLYRSRVGIWRLGLGGDTVGIIIIIFFLFGLAQNDAVLPVCFEKKEARASAASSSSSCRVFVQAFCRTVGVRVRPRRPQLQEVAYGSFKVVSMVSKGSCDPDDPTVDPPLKTGFLFLDGKFEGVSMRFQNEFGVL